MKHLKVLGIFVLAALAEATIEVIFQIEPLPMWKDMIHGAPTFIAGITWCHYYFKD
jgi:hypothetical protein